MTFSRNHNARLPLTDSKIEEMATRGIAVHHAGLELSDRKAIEEAYKKGKLMLLCSTSVRLALSSRYMLILQRTLAVGVNLPAHLVVIKGTSTWTGAGSGHREYTDIDIQQMMGRAGRPQYDDSGTVVVSTRTPPNSSSFDSQVMCARQQVGKYKDMLASKTILESSLCVPQY